MEGVSVESPPPSSWKPVGDLDLDRPLDATGQALAPAAIIKRRRIESGELILHVVADLKFAGDGRTPWTLCSCGELFEGRDNEDTARMFNGHSTSMKHAQARDDDRPRSGPVEVIHAKPKPPPKGPRPVSEKTLAKYARAGTTCHYGGPKKSYGATTTDVCTEPRQRSGMLCAIHVEEWKARSKAS